MFTVGQRVLCVNGKFETDSWLRLPYRPKRGHIYTVRETLLINYDKRPEVPAILLEEIKNPALLWDLNPHLGYSNPNGFGTFFELGFPEERFSPIKDKETDISIFKEMLNKTPELIQ